MAGRSFKIEGAVDHKRATVQGKKPSGIIREAEAEGVAIIIGNTKISAMWFEADFLKKYRATGK